jgi:superfamily II DNA or RNA helicase
MVPRDAHLLQLLADYPDVMDRQKPTNPIRSATEGGFVGILDPERQQPEAVERVLGLLTASPLGGGALLSLPTGFGKTTCGLYIAARIAMRTLILVHTQVLQTQWVDRIRSAVPGATPVTINPQTYKDGQWEGTHVIILLQTLLARAKTSHEPLCEAFDLVIVDETHHLAAPTLCR